MPVTFLVTNHPSKPYAPSPWQRDSISSEPNAVLAGLPTAHQPKALLQSSVDGKRKPDDVWIAIVSQLNFYINAHAEELRDKFVDHADKKELVVTSMAPSLTEVDFGDLAVQMIGQIDKNVKDKSLVPWVLPNFTTTTPNDTVICSALIMSTLKQYFNYTMRLGCGIPFITLQGTQEDWQSILDRIDKIPEFGEEPTEWATMLSAILKRFVHAFDKGGPQADKDFWERMVHESPGGSFVPFISGWITAFCAWDTKGRFFTARKNQHGFGMDPPQWVINLTFDGVWFPRVHNAPEGYAEVDVLVSDEREGKEYNCTMLAGHVAITMDGEDKQKLDTLRIAPQWFMYVKGGERDAQNGFW
ncbi:hypothetical protein H0H92_009153 [Tricholoma furcatifolium]|nr:hypothetical protein H0H92_009153 [Tricholoma furcatifolium]